MVPRSAATRNGDALDSVSFTIFLLSPHRQRWTPPARPSPCNRAGSPDESAACTAQVPRASAHGIPLILNSSCISSTDASISPFDSSETLRDRPDTRARRRRTGTRMSADLSTTWNPMTLFKTTGGRRFCTILAGPRATSGSSPRTGLPRYAPSRSRPA